MKIVKKNGEMGEISDRHTFFKGRTDTFFKVSKKEC